MAVLLKPILPPTRSGRTFFVASVALGAGAAIQLLALIWYFAHGIPARRRAELIATAYPPTVVVPTATPPLVMTVPTPVPAALAASLAPPALPPDAPALPPPVVAAIGADIPQEGPQLQADIARPTPAPAPRFQGNPTNLLEYARALRQRGDTNSALARLRDALATEPNNPDLIAETALTYEAMQLSDKAFEQWQRVFNMGESIGALYYMADSKLHNAPGQPGAANTGLAVAGTGRDVNGFQDNAVLKITDLQSQEVRDDPTIEKKTAIRIVVKGRPGTVIDPSKVKIETYFYDLLDGKDVVLTDAETSFKWLSEPVDWAGDSSEILETAYTRMRTESAPASPVAALAAPTPTPLPSVNPVPGAGRGRRKRPTAKELELAQALAASAPPAADALPPVHVRIYLGYSVRLYYDRQLQDVQADPIRLLQQFPPPLTLPVE